MTNNTVSVQTTWITKMQFDATGTASQETVRMDAPVESGGKGEGIRPMETLLSAVAGCSGMDVISILNKMRQEVTGLSIVVSGERAAQYPRAFERITVEYLFRGRDLSGAAVARAIALSVEKYCGVLASLRAEITTSYRLETD